MNKNIVFSHIRKNCIKHILLFIIPLAGIIAVLVVLPFGELFWSREVASADEAIAAHNEGITFVKIKPEVIYYTGYDLMEDGKSKGAYYYEITSDNKCIFYLMNEPTDTIEDSYKMSGILVRFENTNGLFDNMLEMLSGVIGWNYEDLKNVTADTMLVQVDKFVFFYHSAFTLLAGVAVCLTYVIILNLLYAVLPVLHPAIRKVKRFCKYNSYGEMSEELDYQVVTDVAHAGGMYITEKFFIHLGSFYVSIVPLSEVIFVYKNSQLKNFVGMHFKILYTLHVRGNRKFKCACPGKSKEDADFILDYFANNYPDILNGYTDENRKLAIKKIKEHKNKNEET